MKHVLEHFKKTDPILYEVGLKVSVPARVPSGNLFADLCDHIISQQLSVKAGDAIFKRFIALFPKGDITPKQTLKIKPQMLRDIGLSWSKVKYIHDLAQKVVDKTVVLQDLETMNDEDIIVTLTKVKGIGVWTVEMFLMTSMGREDIFSYGDLGLRKAIKRWYKLEQTPTKEQAEYIAQKWSPYRTFACRILWRSLELKET